jgi:hypothetical protein
VRFFERLKFGTGVADKESEANLKGKKSTMIKILQNELVLNLFSHQAVGWILVKMSSLWSFIRVLY